MSLEIKELKEIIESLKNELNECQLNLEEQLKPAQDNNVAYEKELNIMADKLKQFESQIESLSLINKDLSSKCNEYKEKFYK